MKRLLRRQQLSARLIICTSTMLGVNNIRLAAFAAISLSLARLVAADVTIDGFSAVDTATSGATEIVSATIAGITSLSVQANGATVYAETEVESLAEIVVGTSTITFVSEPTTLVFTFAEDASLYSASIPSTMTLPGAGGVVSAGQEVVCTGTAGAPVTCVEEVVQSAGGIPEAATVTYSAVRTPIFTIKSSGARAVVPVALMSLAAGAACIVLQSI